MVGLLLGIIYLSFISLGLPDGLLGAAWPTMYPELSVPVSYAGMVSMVICAGTITSSLLSDRLNRRFGTGVVTAVSTCLTAGALLGFSFCDSYWGLLLFAIPYGLGAGGVDAALNGYVALHYASRHMSWLHCMWGLGASIGPYIMGYALTGGKGWHLGYRYVALLQITLTVVLFACVPMWTRVKSHGADQNEPQMPPKNLKQVLAIPGAKEVLIAFFCYCAAESTAMLWASTYLVGTQGMSEERAASLARLFFIGITSGRAISGFLTYKLNDGNMIRLGQAVMISGILTLLLPFGPASAMVGLVLIGLGCAPIYPSVIHSTPDHFGAENAQAIIGVQMAAAYVGSLAMPPVFGMIANHISVSLLPRYLAAITAVMILMCEKLNRKCAR
jgi:fucose permease